MVGGNEQRVLTTPGVGKPKEFVLALYQNKNSSLIFYKKYVIIYM
jgi:hypothetical protein